MPRQKRAADDADIADRNKTIDRILIRVVCVVCGFFSFRHLHALVVESVR
ncbi:hypothetical protein FTUN_3561 [Frigoriglobus tundricola]|uniref:Uncharacterized protein n=1 Tax=Frigoriglobus tundricola TaxID=2774151 RepID=A0A6M5YPN0_9BACT|nr:hypothetical protein FTUN_3561 [Frigoriglobus tundricola]